MAANPLAPGYGVSAGASDKNALTAGFAFDLFYAIENIQDLLRFSQVQAQPIAPRHRPRRICAESGVEPCMRPGQFGRQPDKFRLARFRRIFTAHKLIMA